VLKETRKHHVLNHENNRPIRELEKNNQEGGGVSKVNNGTILTTNMTSLRRH
jgi:hypothetical protein